MLHTMTQERPLYTFESIVQRSRSNLGPVDKVYSSKKVTHNILVYMQVQIIVAVTCVLYISYVIEYKE